MKRLLLLISLVTFFVSIPLIAAAAPPAPPDCLVSSGLSVVDICYCRLDNPGWFWGEYKNLGECVSEVNACNQADVPAVCECKYALRTNKGGYGDCDFKNLGDCVSYLMSEGYSGGGLPPCPYED
jgi:hypothetical protein